MSTVKESVAELNTMILGGKVIEAFDKFYAPEVVMQENEYPETVGFDANRKREEEFVANVTEFRAAEVKRIVIDGNHAVVEWFMDYTHNTYGSRKFHQLNFQEWKDGKIVREKFYYGA